MWSTAQLPMPSSMLCVPPLTAASFALSRWLMNIGMAIAARMPMMMMTMRSSMSVKPRWRLSFVTMITSLPHAPSSLSLP